MRCPETGLACSTAYNKRRCRCSACKSWSVEMSAAHRRRTGARIQIRKLPGTVFCPLSKKTALTSFKQGCRCSTCREANRAEHRRRRARAAEVQRQRELVVEEAIAAFRVDPAYMIEMAKDAAEAFELANSES